MLTTTTTQDYDTGASRSLPLAFNFTFFCSSRDTAIMAVDGRMLFGAPDLDLEAALSAPGRAWPTAFEEIAVMSTDLTTDVDAASGRVKGNRQSMYYALVGKSPQRVFVAQWTQAYIHKVEGASGDLGAVGTFQVLLYEDGGHIVLRYPALVDSSAGAQVTVGIGSAQAGQRYTYGSGSIASYAGRAVRFSPMTDASGACVAQYSMTELSASDIVLSDSLDSLQLLAPSGVPDGDASVTSPSGDIIVTEDMTGLASINVNLERGSAEAGADTYFRLQVFPGSGWYT